MQRNYCSKANQTTKILVKKSFTLKESFIYLANSPQQPKYYVKREQPSLCDAH